MGEATLMKLAEPTVQQLYNNYTREKVKTVHWMQSMPEKLFITVQWYSAQTYLQPQYGNGVFGNVYLLALDAKR